MPLRFPVSRVPVTCEDTQDFKSASRLEYGLKSPGTSAKLNTFSANPRWLYTTNPTGPAAPSWPTVTVAIFWLRLL